MMRAPVAANGWPTASDEPTTLSLLRSMLPNGWSRPSLSRQKLSDSQAESVHNRSEEHTSELQSLMRISYAVFCLKKKNKTIKRPRPRHSSHTHHPSYYSHLTRARQTQTEITTTTTDKD